MTFWVLEDVEKQEGSGHDVYICLIPYQWKATGTGVVISSKAESMAFCQPFSVWYYDYNKKNIRVVKIRGMEEDGLGEIIGKPRCNPGHTENIRFL